MKITIPRIHPLALTLILALSSALTLLLTLLISAPEGISFAVPF